MKELKEALLILKSMMEESAIKQREKFELAIELIESGIKDIQGDFYELESEIQDLQSKIDW